jgi:hypothetical protein
VSPGRYVEAERRLTLRAGDARRAYLEAHVFELSLAIVAIVTAATFFLSPATLEGSAIGHAVHPFDYAWNGLYLAGGLLIVVGLVRPTHRLELAGLIMFGAAITVAGVALAALGSAGWALKIVSLGTYTAIATGCVIRALAIVRVSAALAEVRDELERYR